MIDLPALVEPRGCRNGLAHDWGPSTWARRPWLKECVTAHAVYKECRRCQQRVELVWEISYAEMASKVGPHNRIEDELRSTVEAMRGAVESVP